MATIINNPGESRGSGNDLSGASGVIVGAVVVVLVLIAVLFFTIPYFRDRINAVSNPGTPVINPTINVQLPPINPSASTTP